MEQQEHREHKEPLGHKAQLAHKVLKELLVIAETSTLHLLLPLIR
jgi:hypothetical protein